MIDELHVTDVALIHDATIEPAPGLTVLTGETGTGKTALLSALKLLVGERADASSVREGSAGLMVEGRVYLRGEGEDPDGTIVRRRVSADGRGRVEIDGHMASVRELAERVGSSVDLCGQHEHQRLLRVQTHVELLDAYAGPQVDEALATYREAFRAARDAASELERIQEMVRSADERVDQAAFELSRIDEVGPSLEEYAELEETLPRAAHAEALLEAAEGARRGLTGSDGACDALSTVVELLRGASAHDATLDTYADTVESALIDMEDIASELRSYRDSVDFDPDELDRMHARMASYQGLLRTFGPGLEHVLERRARAAELVEAARDGSGRVKRAQEALDAAEARLGQLAKALHDVRAACAPELARAVSEQMAFLEMGSAEVTFVVELLPRAQWTLAGPSRVELMYRPAAGMTARPLRKIASGGEVSRVTLAVRVVLGEAAGSVGAGADTLVFDEVDAGVGGATAVALAQVLARLAKTHQVIVVTHLPQVAVAAERHYLVAKRPGEGALPETQLVQIAGEERTREIARMLSGAATEASLAHARELLGATASS